MKTRHILPVLAVLLGTIACRPADRYITITGYAQGGTYGVKLNLNGENGLIHKTSEELKLEIDSILVAIDESVSGYNPKSQLTAFNAGRRIRPSGIFIDLYRRSRALFEETDGVVDVASAPLYDAWGFGFKSGEMPSAAVVDSIRNHSGMKLLRPDMEDILLPDGQLWPQMLVAEGQPFCEPALNYNAVAQGYSCDLVAAYLRRLGVKDMMVDIGEIFCQGRNPKGKPWTIAIDTPADNNNDPGADICGVFTAPETPCGIVTSGNYRKFYVRDGKKYAHTIDPRTGCPVTHNLLSATVIAKDGLTADAYATYCMVVGLEEAMAFISEPSRGIEGCLVFEADGKMETWVSPGFSMRR